jgi:hypothetical protein
MFSDVGVLITIPGRMLINSEKKNILVEILERAIIVYGLPCDAPVQVHTAIQRLLGDIGRGARE